MTHENNNNNSNVGIQKKNLFPVNTTRLPDVLYDTCYERVVPDVSPMSFMTRAMNVSDPTCRRRLLRHVR